MGSIPSIVSLRTSIYMQKQVFPHQNQEYAIFKEIKPLLSSKILDDFLNPQFIVLN